MRKTLGLFLLVSTFGFATAQTGGVYDASHNVVASGGTQSAGGIFVATGTVGQQVAGTTSTGGQFNLHGGFWIPNPLAPTAATVSIEGRIFSTGQLANRRVMIVLHDAANGEIRSTVPNQFGYYCFENVEVGRFYLVEPQSKVYSFTPESRGFQLLDSLIDVDFTTVSEP